MADTLCGPANALQHFSKHTTVDRTLQQDRLTRLRPPGHEFRTPPNANIEEIDAELAAFEAGQLSHFGQDEPAAYQSLEYDSIPGEGGAHMEILDWASDFQRLHLENVQSPSSVQAQPSLQPQMQDPTATRWHDDFMRQDLPTSSVPDASRYYQRPYQPPMGYSMQNGFATQSPNANLFHYGAEATKTVDNQAKEFDKAFDMFDTEDLIASSNAREHVAVEDTKLQRQDVQSEIYGWDSSKPAEEYSHLADPYLYKPHMEGTLRTSQSESESTQDDADALAATATQLLENVKDEPSRKFQESSFLSLMRQLRDREVHVEGDKIVDSPQALHPGGKFYPHRDDH